MKTTKSSLAHEARLAVLILMGVWGVNDPDRIRDTLFHRLEQSHDILLLLDLLAQLFCLMTTEKGEQVLSS